MYFSKNYLFSKFKVSMTSLRRHNRCILERPRNFAIFEGRSPKFCKLCYFDAFSRNDINFQIEGSYDVSMMS